MAGKEKAVMKVLDTETAQGFIRMSEDGWHQGWHECHGGNLTYRMKKREADNLREDFRKDAPWLTLPVRLKSIAGEFFMVTGSGKFMRNMALDPADSFGIIELNEEGSAYRIVWGLENMGKPTSELPAHLMNQEVKKLVTEGRHRVVYHAHPANIIALSFLLPLRDEIFTRELWEIMPECAMTFPGGIGVLPWMIPGTKEIAQRSCELMKEYDVVVWAQHGLFVSGDSFDHAFGLMHTVEKAADIYLKTISVPGRERLIPSAQELREMATRFRLKLPEKFLYNKDCI